VLDVHLTGRALPAAIGNSSPAKVKAAVQRMNRRFLISKKKTGLGSDLATIMGAWYYARRTARTLVIDWRNSLYLADRAVNAFPRFFQPLDQIDGVKIICDDSVGKRNFPEPVLPLHKLPAREYRELLRMGTDIAAPTLINTRPMHIFPPLAVQQRIIRAVRLHDEVQREVDEFRQAEFAGATVLGVHFRHGNGERLAFGRDLSLQESCQKIALRCQELCGNLSRSSSFPVRTFLATDSQEAEETLRALVPGVVTRNKTYHAAGTGRLHRRSLGLRSAKDALVEMFLLARCNALIYNNSWFSYYARLTGRFDVTPVSIHPDSSYAAL
jgi:hypothetical protein